MKVNLNDVIEAIEFEGELLKHYYNKSTPFKRASRRVYSITK
ncbi:hypothetical protein [Clostridium baratii]|nr:hypothetical protein [Clostridium baratii]STB00072.1 Uncharacterised protein [Clostridium baratii]